MPPDELKNTARTIKGKISAGELTSLPLPELGKGTFLIGPKLDIEYPAGFSPPLIGTCLLSGENFTSMPTPPRVSFRAAAVANMFYRPLPIENGTGYKWKIGKLFWLPKK